MRFISDWSLRVHAGRSHGRFRLRGHARVVRRRRCARSAQRQHDQRGGRVDGTARFSMSPFGHVHDACTWSPTIRWPWKCAWPAAYPTKSGRSAQIRQVRRTVVFIVAKERTSFDGQEQEVMVDFSNAMTVAPWLPVVGQVVGLVAGFVGAIFLAVAQGLAA
jgi:hypothetical protein